MKHFLLPTLLVLAVTGCTPGGYASSNAAIAELQRVQPDLSGIDEAAACDTNTEALRATVLFANGDVADYRMAGTDISQQWAVSREAFKKQFDADESYGCFNARTLADQHTPDYWLKTYLGSARLFVDEEIVHSRPYNATEAARVHRFGLVLQRALAEHRRFTPPENSWGLTHPSEGKE